MVGIYNYSYTVKLYKFKQPLTVKLITSYLSYIGYYSSYIGRKISSIVNKDCKDLNVKIIFSPFKLSTMFSPKDFVPDSLCGVRYILVKPIGILTHVLMSISFETKIPTFLNRILELLKVVGISVISLVLRFSIMPALTLNF